jgi:hypothetical protein
MIGLIILMRLLLEPPEFLAFIAREAFSLSPVDPLLTDPVAQGLIDDTEFPGHIRDGALLVNDQPWNSFGHLPRRRAGVGWSSVTTGMATYRPRCPASGELLTSGVIRPLGDRWPGIRAGSYLANRASEFRIVTMRYTVWGHGAPRFNEQPQPFWS